MAVHNVSFTIPARELGKADAEFVVKRDKAKLGELRISNGSVVWFPNGNSYGYKMPWADLGNLLVEHGARSEKR